ncbi:HD domain-containing protein [Clostridium botulinum]|uniref:HD domain protein n=2 Tax=Clostridium botulinum TaxID=1491 RepID=C1FMK0_CLOBJ|nr:HD domain-containing protein [Clostridium botulinum]ACO85838.1 HD domain protein [Clostridium botulinum A2 str. Kyoto]APC79480.1 OB-fold nucleic acid binding domain protein [Clostridium botulinum]APC82836.1 OB-fold nucleic acid binding domain protein [Clostridium botulinum]APH21738.1 OB-fold nucleic acid binding domain protein [Clostridium botulinum]APQ70120.1 OB-fold nucleic acid binding domain protein [Clostridium botulinum]
MKIADITSENSGEVVEFNALVNDKRTNYKKDGSPYLLLILQDNTGTIAFPVWDKYEQLNNLLEINSIIAVRGVAATFNGNMQIRNPAINVFKESINYSDFVPEYDIPKNLINYFNETINSLEDKYKKIAIAATGAMGYDKKRWNEFITCVAAEKFHGNKRGGLFLHTVGVMKTIENIIDDYITNPFYMSAQNCINKDRLMLKAIVHDIMKIKEYDYEGIIRRKPIKMDHLVMGASYINEINSEVGKILDEEELDDICYSILSHHGEFGNFEPKTIEDVLLNAADIIDSQIVNAIENKI